MEIGYPTDVKHVAHIGWDGQSSNAPSWVCNVVHIFVLIHALGLNLCVVYILKNSFSGWVIYADE